MCKQETNILRESGRSYNSTDQTTRISVHPLTGLPAHRGDGGTSLANTMRITDEQLWTHSTYTVIVEETVATTTKHERNVIYYNKLNYHQL